MAPPRTLRKRNDKYAKNVNKRGNVPIGKAAMHDKDPEPPKRLVVIFFFLVVGSIFVQVYRMAEFGSNSLKSFSENFATQQAAQEAAQDAAQQFESSVFEGAAAEDATAEETVDEETENEP